MKTKLICIICLIPILCDTLVNYAYAFNSRYSLPTYDTTWTTPLAVYNYFPTDSDLLIPENITAEATTKHTSKNLNIDSINEYNINKLNVDDLYQILQNSHNISKDEITYIWKLLTSNQVDNKVKALFYDFISFEDPSYLVNEIIQQAKVEKGEPKHKLLVVLQSIYQNSFKRNDETGLKEILNYFNELKHKNLNKNDGGIVYRGLAALSKKHITTKKANLTNMDKIHVNILSLKNDRANEKKYVKSIIYNIDKPDDNLLVTASYQYLSQLLINSDLKFFSQESKQLFKNYLETNKVVNYNQSMLYTSAYLEFKAALNANTIEEIPVLVNDYIKLLDPEVKESIFIR